MNTKLLTIFDKINQHYTEEKFIEKIQNYNEQKLTVFNYLYQYIKRFWISIPHLVGKEKSKNMLVG